jgi:O-succinylbenzoic acid--CoA ligase
MTPSYQNLHQRFRINGLAFDQGGLFELAYSYIKEGAPFEKEIGVFLLDWLDNAPTLQLNTSGTTGVPKIITISKQAMVLSAIATANFFNLQPGDKALHCLPTRYVAGKMMLVRAFIIGLELDLLPPTSALEELHKDKKYDFVALVPLQAEQNIDKLEQFKKIIIGGQPISNLLSVQLQNLNAEIFETYGMTETITHIAAKRVGAEYFTVLPNITIATDDRNCLNINIPAISETIIKTNDIVEMVSPQSFKWIGRFDHVINSGGIKLFPEQLEAKLSKQIAIPFFITGIPDEKLGQKVILVIEGKSFKLSEVYYTDLEKYEHPKEVFFIPQFTRTQTAKIDIKNTLKSIGL